MRYDADDKCTSALFAGRARAGVAILTPTSHLSTEYSDKASGSQD